MTGIGHILRSVPFLGHLSSQELSYLEKEGDMARFSAGQSVDLKKMKSLCIVVYGMFGIEAAGNADIVYLSRGSSFGSIPFCDYKRRGVVKSLVDSEIIILREEVLLRLFLQSYRAMRGYVRILHQAGFPLASIGESYFHSQSTVLACVGEQTGVGKSLGAALLGIKFSKSSKTIVLDISQEGKSILEFYERDKVPPISQRANEIKSGESFLRERIVEVDDNLAVLNICHDSLVALDPEIFNIVLFILSRDYSVIIADITSNDSVLREHIISKIDYVLNFLCKQSKAGQSFFLERELSEGQRVINIRNDFFDKNPAPFSGGYILESNGEYARESSLDNLREFARGDFCRDIETFISSPKKTLVLESAQNEAVFYTGFLELLAESEIEFDWIYSSSYSFILLALMLIVSSENLKEAYSRFFSTDFVRRTVRASFPEQYIYGISKFMKYAGELSQGKRVEMFRSLAMCKLSDNGDEKIFSSGEVDRLMGASFSIFPFFEAVDIGGGHFASGYPESQALPLECFRTISDRVISVELGNRKELFIGDKKYPRVFKNILSKNSRLFTKEDNLYADGKFILEVSEKEFKFDRIFDLSKKFGEGVLNKMTFMEKK